MNKSNFRNVVYACPAYYWNEICVILNSIRASLTATVSSNHKLL
jgi:hypothetical protein